MSVEPRKMDRRPPPLRTIPGFSPPLDLDRSSPMRIPGRNSPKPSSWQATMTDLSRSLQMICCSPPGARPMSPANRSGHPFASSVFPFGDGGAGPMSPPARAIRGGGDSVDAGPLYRANSVQGHQARRPAQRPVFVRHIETNAGLRNRLVEICRTTDRIRRTGSPVPCTAPAQTTTSSKPPFPLWTAKPPDPTRNAFRVRADVTSHGVEELVVSVRERRRLVIETVSGSGGGRIVHESTLPPGTRIRNLVAEMSSESGVLSVRERAPEAADVTFNETGSASYVPIVRLDESRLELTIVLRVPRCFRFEEVSVQTIDDRVVVTGKRRSLPLPEAAFDFRSEGCGGGGSGLPTFRASLQLPCRTDSRSVSASMTNNHQLLVRGTLGPLPRRSSL